MGVCAICKGTKDDDQYHNHAACDDIWVARSGGGVCVYCGDKPSTFRNACDDCNAMTSPPYRGYPEASR